jgi:hypothetical protein
MRRLIAAYALDLDPLDERFVNPSFLDRTLVGSRRQLADILRLQLYGAAWAAVGIDQVYPEVYTPRAEDLENDESWYGFTASQMLAEDDLAFDIVAAGASRVADIPLLLVNEPIFISSGRNSDVRYNAWYPRWAYDGYRALLAQTAAAHLWTLLDAWDAVSPAEFTDSPVHLTPAGVRQFAARIIPLITGLSANP